MTASGPTLYIAALPPAPGHCEIKVSATLSDGTEARGWATWTSVSAAVADRIQRLCQLTHLVSTVVTAPVRIDPLLDPLRTRVARPAALPDPNRLVADLQKQLEAFVRGH
jgi:hypothetical protein